MPDITQATTGDQVVFSANNAKAETWMGSPTVSFSLPAESSMAADFKKRAGDAGLTVRPF